MSIVIAGNNPAVYFLGSWTQSNSGGHNFKTQAGNQSRLEVDVTDTQCEAFLFGGQSYTMTIDGTPTTFTATGGAGVWAWNTLYTGLSNAKRNVRITGPYIESDTTLRLSDTGSVSAPSGYGTYTRLVDAPFTTYGKVDGSPSTAAVSSYAAGVVHQWPAGDSGVRFPAAVTRIGVWASNLSGKIALYQDGAAVETITPSGANSFDLLMFTTTLDGAAHVYEVVCIGLSSTHYMVGLMTSGGTGIGGTAEASKSTVAWYGDSIVAYNSSGMADSRTGDAWLTTRAASVGRRANRRGTSGQKVSTFLRDNTSQITGLSPKPALVWVCGGVNDQILGTTIGDASTAGTFTGDYKTMLSNLNAGLTAGTPLMCRAILPNTATNNANRGSYNTAIQAAITAYNATSPACPAVYVPTDGWNASSGSTELADSNLHPNGTGYAKIANREIPVAASKLGGTAYTTSGTSGTVTVTLAAGATFTGDQTITLTAGAGTITATATGTITSNGTGTVAVKPDSGQTSFTYTATSTTSVTYANDQTAWTDPAATSYIGGNSAPATPTISAGTPTATSVALTGSAFSDGDVGDTHAASQWQVDDDPAFGTPLISTGDDATHKTSYTATGLAEKTTYYARVRYKDSAGNYSGWSTAVTFTTADVTAPVLSNPTGTAMGPNTAQVTVDTDTGEGTLSLVVTPAAQAAPTGTQVETGKDATGAAAAYAEAKTPTSTGSKFFFPSGLSENTQYKAHFVQRDAAGNLSAVASSPAFTTDDVTAPVLSSISAGTPTKTTATITWTTSEPADSVVRYGPTAAYGTSTPLADASPKVTGHSVTITGLTRGTTYHYQVESGDSSGNVAQSADQTFTTAAGEIDVQIPAGTPRASGYTHALGNVEQGSTQDVVVTIANPGNGALALSSYTPAGDLTIPSAGPSSIAASGIGTVTVRLATATLGARSGTLTIASDDPDEATYTITVTATAVDTTAPVISGVSGGTPGQASATVGWTTNEQADSQVEYGTTTAYGATTALDATLVTSHSVALAGLTAGTTYHFRVKSRDASGNLATSADFTLTTAAPPADTTPPAISNVSSGTPGQTSAVITWTTDEAADSQVDYGLTAAYGNSSALDAAKVTGHSVTLSGLTVGTTYHFRVRSRDAAGNLATSADYTLTTAAGTGTGETTAEGYYAKRAKMLRKAGNYNLAIYSNLGNDTQTLDEDALQEAMDETDRWVDSLARRYDLAADAIATDGHVLATDNVEFGRVSDLASQWAVTELYRARGVTGDTQGAEGVMTAIRAEAEAELKAIFADIGGDAGTAAGQDGITVVGCPTHCPPFGGGCEVIL